MFSSDFDFVVHSFGINGTYRIPVTCTDTNHFIGKHVESDELDRVLFTLVEYNRIVLIIVTTEADRLAKLGCPKKWYML